MRSSFSASLIYSSPWRTNRMFPLNLFGGSVGGDLIPSFGQTADSDSGSDFAGGGRVTIEGLRIGGASDQTLLLLGAAALVVLFLVVRK